MPDPITSQVAGIANGDVNWGPKVQADVASINGQLTIARQNTYRPADAPSRAAIAGQRGGDLATQADNLVTYRYTGGSWQPYDSAFFGYTPTYQGVTASASFGRYRYSGGKVLFEFSFQLSAAPTATMWVYLPVGHDTADNGLGGTSDLPRGTILGLDQSDSYRNYALFPTWGNANNLALNATTGGGGVLIGATGSAPIPWAAGDRVFGAIEYDPAF